MTELYKTKKEAALLKGSFFAIRIKNGGNNHNLYL